MKNKRSNFAFNAILVAAALVLSATAVIMGPYFRRGYDIEVDTYSKYTFKAPKNVVNELATERLRKEAADNVEMIYKKDKEATQLVLDTFDEVFDLIRADRNARNPLETPYTRAPENDNSITLSSFGINITTTQRNYLLDAPSDVFSNMFSSMKLVLEYSLDRGIKEDELQKVKSTIREEINNYLTDSTERIIASEVVNSIILSNLIPDEDATAKARQLAADSVPQVEFASGQNIVSDGEKITEEIYQVLDSLGYTSKSLFENIYNIIGVISICIVAFASMIIYLYYFFPSVSSSRKSSLMLFTFFVLSIAFCWTLRTMPYQFAPILLFTMLTSILIDSRLASVYSLLLTIIASFILEADLEFMLYFVLTGTFASIFAKYTTERSKVFSIGLIISLISGISSVSLTLLLNATVSYQMIAGSVVYSVLNGVLTVILCIGSLPFWEAVFDVVTPIKLLDLANPSNKLLRKLVLQAPGTYHHSLIVANLAETAAYDIGANALLTKVGGYYHDIGKLKFPEYFAENIVGENPHNSMSPYDSATVIKEHVSYGMELAKEYKLPKSIVNFIAEHHATTLIKYFYNKALELNPDEIDESCFRYNFNLPSSRETAIVMIADTVEAAVRSMIPMGKTSGEVESFIRDLIKDKIDDGQLVKSQLTLTDLETVVQSFMKVFKGMYHERIPYPKTVKPASAKK